MESGSKNKLDELIRTKSASIPITWILFSVKEFLR